MTHFPLCAMVMLYNSGSSVVKDVPAKFKHVCVSLYFDCLLKQTPPGVSRTTNRSQFAGGRLFTGADICWCFVRLRRGSSDDVVTPPSFSLVDVSRNRLDELGLWLASLSQSSRLLIPSFRPSDIVNPFIVRTYGHCQNVRSIVVEESAAENEYTQAYVD